MHAGCLSMRACSFLMSTRSSPPTSLSASDSASTITSTMASATSSTAHTVPRLRPTSQGNTRPAVRRSHPPASCSSTRTVPQVPPTSGVACAHRMPISSGSLPSIAHSMAGSSACAQAVPPITSSCASIATAASMASAAGTMTGRSAEVGRGVVDLGVPPCCLNGCPRSATLVRPHRGPLAPHTLIVRP
jgi:hypothetical protein